MGIEEDVKEVLLAIANFDRKSIRVWELQERTSIKDIDQINQAITSLHRTRFIEAETPNDKSFRDCIVSLTSKGLVEVERIQNQQNP